MNFIPLILVAITGVIIGSYFGVRKKDPKATLGRGSLIFGQAKKKQENKEKMSILRNIHKIIKLI